MMSKDSHAYTLEQLAAEQERLRLNFFDYAFAWELGSRIRANAAKLNAPISIQVAHGTDVVFASLLPGATPDNWDWAARKRAVANRFHRSSLAMRLEAEANNYDFSQRFLLPKEHFIASGGGVPLMLKGGTLVATVGISGLSDVEDHRMIVTALRELLSA
jgi:uncharacterized protein (UPF0303 family)